MIQSRPKTLRSYAIRSGRITESQQRAFENYWLFFGLDLNAGLINSGTLFGNQNALILEIGFGNGDGLLTMAEDNPDINFIGIEVFQPGVGHLMNRAMQSKLRNLKIYLADATDVLTECIPDNSLDRVQLYFPDPWPKRRHHKRRLVQPRFIDLVASKLKMNGYFHLATDWFPYAQSMLGHLSQAKGLANSSDGFIPRPAWRPVTKFEVIGVQQGHSVWELMYQKIT